jgi:hypothetical protein
VTALSRVVADRLLKDEALSSNKRKGLLIGASLHFAAWNFAPYYQAET